MILQALEKITGIFVVVYDGQHALKFTLGRAGDVVRPVFDFKFPIVQNYRVQETKGQVFGLVVRSRGLGGNIVAGLRSIVGGEIHEQTSLL